MKLKYLIIIFFLCFTARFCYSDPLYIKIYYLNGEKSKDSHSAEEEFLVNGNNISYTVKYSSKKEKSQEDAEKNCVLNDKDIKNIIAAIDEKQLRVIDSLFEKDTKMKSFEIFCNIAIDLKIDGVDYRIRINGDSQEFKNKDLYNNSLYLIGAIRDLIKDC
jgi:hypothetical protein